MEAAPTTSTVPRGWPVALALMAVGAVAAWGWRPAEPLRVDALRAVEAALGTSVTAFHVGVTPGKSVDLVWARVGSPAAPLEPGPAEGPPPDQVVTLRRSEVWLPGGIRLVNARGTLRRTAAGAQADLTGTATVAGVTAEGCRIQLIDGGRAIRVRAGHCFLAPRGIELSAIGLDAQLRRDGTAGAWRGTVTSSAVLCAGIPGRELSAGLTIEPSGAWSALPVRTGLAGGIVRGRATYRDGRLKFAAAIDPKDAPLGLRLVPPRKIGATTPLEGVMIGQAEAEVTGDSITGRVRLEGRAITLSDLPALLSLTRTIQFRMRQAVDFERASLVATLGDTGLMVQSLSLEGEQLAVASRGSGFIGWDGMLALPVRVTAPQGLLGGVPLVGNVLSAIRPGTPGAVKTHIDLNVGGSLADPEADLHDPDED